MSREDAKNTAILAILERLQQDGSLIATWGEADGCCEYVVRADGETLGTGDYQSEGGPLSALGMVELANILEYGEPYASSEAYQFTCMKEDIDKFLSNHSPQVGRSSLRV